MGKPTAWEMQKRGTSVVILTSDKGQALAINADLIETASEAWPGTALKLVDGKTYFVSESIAEVVERVASFRGAVLAAAKHQGQGAAPSPVRLRLLPGHGAGSGKAQAASEMPPARGER
ncbi:MAG TPA: flagellar FlbD family protein [Acidimicrobiales bacterium]|nr:flagellar FlbD family protein [Acidimicrobiales bacterium]